MKKAQSVALIAAGSLTGSTAYGFGRLSDRLGPVMAPSFRLASRIANSLRAGHPIRDYSSLDSCRLILVSVPDARLPAIVGEIAAANISWTNKTILLCSAELDSGELNLFAARGASIGSISAIPGFEDPRYLVEGDRLAILESKRLVEQGPRRIVPIERSMKPFYLAALTSTSSLLFALLLAASESLRHAGIPAAVSATILEKQLRKTLRSHVKTGRKAYAAPYRLQKQLHTVAAADPDLAYYLEQSSKLAARLMGKG
jgi:Domain of unknown function (DUF2520)/Rossmann-like domain